MIRSGTLKDASRLADVDPFGGDRAVEARDGRLWIAAEDDGRLTGYASLARAPFHGHPYLAFVFVRVEDRRRGIATALLAHVEAVHRGGRLFVSTEAPNGPMRQLLAKRGYIEAGAVAGLNDDHGGAAEVFFYRDV